MILDGQTGTGKTYSMFGPSGVDMNSPYRGIIPRSLEQLFTDAQGLRDAKEVR